MISETVKQRIRSGKGTATDAEQLLNLVEKYEASLKKIDEIGAPEFPHHYDYWADSAFQEAIAKYEISEIARDALYGERDNAGYGHRAKLEINEQKQCWKFEYEHDMTVVLVDTLLEVSLAIGERWAIDHQQPIKTWVKSHPLDEFKEYNLPPINS